MALNIITLTSCYNSRYVVLPRFDFDVIHFSKFLIGFVSLRRVNTAMHSSMKITYISPLIRTKLVNFLVAMTNFPMIVDKVQISTNYKKSILKFSVILFIALARTGIILPVERETNPMKNLLKCITSKSNWESTKYLLL
jgi:hypothetical protein